jgi:hypothetical protein
MTLREAFTAALAKEDGRDSGATYAEGIDPREAQTWGAFDLASQIKNWKSVW